MQFEFVDHSSIDRETRRRIRRRAAEGRNAGRKLSRPSRKAAFATATARPFPAHARPPQSTRPHGSQPVADNDDSNDVDNNIVALRSPVVDLASSPCSAVSSLPAHLRRYALGYEGSALIQSGKLMRKDGVVPDR